MTTDDPLWERIKDRIDRISLFTWLVILTVACGFVVLLYWGGHHYHWLYWFRALLDGFWNVYDYSIERMRVLTSTMIGPCWGRRPSRFSGA